MKPHENLKYLQTSCIDEFSSVETNSSVLLSSPLVRVSSFVSFSALESSLSSSLPSSSLQVMHQNIICSTIH